MSLIIAVDFDGTCVTHEYPWIGRDIGAVPILRRLNLKGHRIILYTMRSDEHLNKAVQWFEENKILLWAVNGNPEQGTWTLSPKVYANLYIDDAALGAPLTRSGQVGERPYIDWPQVEADLIRRGVL